MMETTQKLESPVLTIGKGTFPEYTQKAISVLEEYGATVLSYLGSPTKGEVTFYHAYEGRHEVELWVSGVDRLTQWELDRLAENKWRVSSIYPSGYKEGMMVDILRNTECDGSKFTDDSLYQAITTVYKAVREAGGDHSVTFSNEKKGLSFYLQRENGLVQIVEGDKGIDWDSLNHYNAQKEKSQ